MTSLSIPEKPFTPKLGSFHSLRPWLVVVALFAALGACVVAGMGLWAVLEGPVRQYPNASALMPKVSGSVSQGLPCSTLHLGLISNAITPDTPDRVIVWYRAARIAYANQGGDPRRFHTRYANGPFRLEYQRTPSVFILQNQTQISIATSLDLRWCP